MMNNILKYISVIILVIFVNNCFAQNDCVIRLQEAELLYSDGKIEKIPELLNSCIENGFGKEQKIRALRLLSLVHLNEDNPELAEDNLLRLLKEDPEYKPNNGIDPLEYIRLYNSIETDPLLSFGGLIGFNYTYPKLLEPIGSNAFKDINAKYSSNGLGISGGLRFVYHVSTKLDLAFEPSFTSSKFQMSESITSEEKISGQENIQFIQIPIVVSYGLLDLRHSQLLIEAGLVYGRYMGGDLDLTNTYVDGNTPDYTESPFATNTIRRKNNFSGILGVATKVYLNRSYMQIGLRYQYGFNNIVNKNAASDVVNSMQWVNRYRDNYFSLSNVHFYVSYNYEFYRHIKK